MTGAAAADRTQLPRQRRHTALADNQSSNDSASRGDTPDARVHRPVLKRESERAMEARAKARYVRVTPRKARRVVDLIRGMPADQAH